MTDRLSKVAVFTALALCIPLLAYLALTRPFYFTNETILAGIIGLEFLLAAVWFYRRVFLPLVLLAFLLAGTEFGGVWTAGRWAVLVTGALIGCFIVLKERSGRFVMFHALAAFAVVAGLVSAAVSRYPSFAFLKAVSLLLLFLYAGTGARLAAIGRENRFLAGWLLGCEILVAALALLYQVGSEALGNPNSLGAVMAVVAPVLLWGMLIDPEPIAHNRRLLLFAVCIFMLFRSQSRAALLAAFVSCALLCLLLRRYKLFVQGMVIMLILSTSLAIFRPERFAGMVSSWTSSVVYKDKDPAQGVFGSRQTPWQTAISSIKKHLWLGSGFGTTDNGQDASAHLARFSTVATSTSENGSSYLTIVSWVGLVGILPFMLLLLSLANKVFRTLLWIWRTGNAFHPAIPLAMVVVAGLVHALFEDWLFAPGYYLCVYFWTLAFIFVDLAPWVPLPSSSVQWQALAMRPSMSGAAPSR